MDLAAVNSGTRWPCRRRWHSIRALPAGTGRPTADPIPAAAEHHCSQTATPAKRSGARIHPIMVGRVILYLIRVFSSLKRGGDGKRKRGNWVCRIHNERTVIVLRHVHQWWNAISYIKYLHLLWKMWDTLITYVQSFHGKEGQCKFIYPSHIRHILQRFVAAWRYVIIH